jgi:membrane fusion protein (multidrug efflux system)
MKRTLLIAGVLIIVAVLILLRIFSGGDAPQAAKAAVETTPVDVVVARDTTTTAVITAVGITRANERVDIVSELSRKVTAILMREGAQVRRGELLFRLDDADLRARLEKLLLDSALASDNAKREKALLDRGGSSRRLYDEASTKLQTLRAEIRTLKADLDKTEIRAPFAGRIGLRGVSVGAWVGPTVLLATLQDVSRIKIDFSVPERFAGDVRQGLPVRFASETLPGGQKAVVEAVEPAVDMNTRMLAVRATADNRSGVMVPGSSVNVTLDLQTSVKCIFVPASALVPSSKGYNLYVVRGGTARLQNVQTGLRGANDVQVLSGIQAGDTVITTNLLRLRPDAPVKVLKAD